MKTGIQKLLVCAALVGAATLVQAQFNYTDNGDGTCTITGYTGFGGAVTIPNSINGLSVVSIGQGAFFDNRTLTSVTIPGSVTSIGNEAFADCYGLSSVTIPGSVTSIGNSAFLQCVSVTGVTIGNGVTSIGVGAFWGCSSLSSVTIPASVTSIGVRAFNICSRLTAITVDAANSFYSSASGVLFDKNQTTLIDFPGGWGGSYTIPASVTSIGPYSVENCTSLTSVTIPASVTSIGVYSFESCTSLTSVTIGNGVTGIGDGAFGYCYSLTNVTIPASVTNIGYEVFYRCTSLTSVIIPASVTSIRSFAFANCTNLTSVTIGNGVTGIGGFAFFNCDSLTAAYFLGDAPSDPGDAFDSDLSGYDPVIVYYLPGATGWGPTFSGAPTELWNPQASAPRVTGGHFGFNITGPSNTVIVVEACTNLAQPVWLPVSTNALGGSGAASFSDSQSGNYPARFYRFRSP